MKALMVSDLAKTGRCTWWGMVRSKSCQLCYCVLVINCQVEVVSGTLNVQSIRQVRTFKYIQLYLWTVSVKFCLPTLLYTSLLT